jgi:hypothetical protein
MRWAPFGNQRHGHPHREQEPVPGGAADQHRQHEEGAPDAHCDRGDRAHDPVELVGERGAGRTLARGHAGDGGELGAIPGCLDDPFAGPRGEEGAGERLVACLQVDRHALAGQRRGIDGDCGGLDEAQVSRDAVTRREHHHVAEHHLGRLHADGSPVAPDRHPDRQQVPQALGGPLRTLLLEEREAGVQDDHEADRHAELGHARHHGQHGGDPQHQREEVGQLTEQMPPRGNPLGGREPVRTVAGEPGRRLGRGQPVRHRPWLSRTPDRRG